MAHPGGDTDLRARLRGHLAQAIGDRRAIVGMNQVECAASHELRKLVSEEASGRGTAVENCAIGRKQSDRVPALFDQGAEAALTDP